MIRDSALPLELARRFLVLCVLASMLALPSVASGHAALQTSSPESGQRLEVAPSTIRIEFNEPLSPDLSGAEVIRSSDDGRVAVRLNIDSRSIQMTPLNRLSKGSYRVEWRAVSTLDGHPVEGTFAFGVRAPAENVGLPIQQNPLEQNGFARISFRAIFYSAVLVFVGGLLVAALWQPRRREEGEEVVATPSEFTGRPALIAGSVAVLAGATVLVLDTANAGGELQTSTFVAYALENVSGRSRLIAIGLLALALLAVWRQRLGVAIACALGATAAIALSGHANSAEPRAVSLMTDWLHLIAASIWIGGMTYMALIVRGRKRGVAGRDRPGLLPVIDRFGDLAVPAFLATIVTGLYNTAIELGGIAALWKTDYGVVLAVKILLVLALLCVSVVHSRVLRPDASDSVAQTRRQRTYWRLLANEPFLAFGVVVLAAALAVFPLPPRQIEGPNAGVDEATCASCLDPVRGEVSVAGQAGSTLVAAWVRLESDGATGTIRTFDRAGAPVNRELKLGDELRTTSCGVGCRRFKVDGSTESIAGELTETEVLHRFSLPVRWRERSTREARQLIRETQARMQALRSLRADEKIAVSSTVGTQTAFESLSPNRLSFTASTGAAGVIIGSRRWSKASRSAPWEGPEVDAERYRTKDSFDWVANAQFAWLLENSKDSREVVVALMNPAEPVWYELQIDRASGLVTQEKMTSPGHFMSTRYFDFNRPIEISPPR